MKLTTSRKIQLLIAIVFTTPIYLIAQVGIGTTTPNAGLDITSTTTGFLPPRIILSATNVQAPVVNPQTGALPAGTIVYNTATAGTSPNNVAPGLYYWDSSKWVAFAGPTGGLDWSLTGNGGTTAGTNFLGTTDAVTLKLRSANAERMQILATGEVSVGAAGTNPVSGDTFSSTGVEYPIVAWGSGTSPAPVISSAFYANQTGIGSLLFGQHKGTGGDGIRIQMETPTSTGAGIIVTHDGTGQVITGEITGTAAITGILKAADFSFKGLDFDDHIGVAGFVNVTDGTTFKGVGVEGTGGTYGVHGIDASGGAGYGVFSTGDSGASGFKSFMIDHPADPANKYLKHFSIESNEVLNIYRGTATFNSDGKTVITLPDYYNLINKNASYLLTPVGAPMPNLFIEKEINRSNKFVIAGGIAGKKVSWNVTAERNDPYAQQNPKKKENISDKKENRGKYLTPELYNQPKSLRIGYSKQTKVGKMKKQHKSR